MADTEQIVEIVLLCAIQLPFAKVMGIFETLLQQYYGIVVTPVGDGLFGQLDARGLILHRYLTLATFPWVEPVGIELCYGLLIPACLVEQGYLLEHEVVALRDESGIFAEKDEACGMGMLQLLV